MPEAGEQRSEVARLLSQISAEYEAAQRGLTGLCYGTSQHEFITKRMENMQHLHVQLQTIVGDAAISLVATQLDASPDVEKEKVKDQQDEAEPENEPKNVSEKRT